MQRVSDAPAGRICRMELTGFASPEGSYSYNARLAERRIRAMKNYLVGLYPASDTSFVLLTVPEDWEGVRKWTLKSGLPTASRVMAIIDRVSNPDARDGYIRRLDRNTTYRRLVREAYPLLRRVEYKVGYWADSLSPEQRREVYRSHPERLTPYEFYRLAGNCGQGTPEFREIILSTVRYYPENSVALNNAACIALQEEDLEAARIYLEQSQESPQKLNNQGVLLLLEGNYSEAYRCFEEAGNCGCAEAIVNRHNLERTQYNLNKAVNNTPN